MMGNINDNIFVSHGNEYSFKEGENMISGYMGKIS